MKKASKKQLAGLAAKIYQEIGKKTNQTHLPLFNYEFQFNELMTRSRDNIAMVAFLIYMRTKQDAKYGDGAVAPISKARRESTSAVYKFFHSHRQIVEKMLSNIVAA